MSHLKRSASAATFEPKFIHYLSDGTGRDSYVTFTNGGMWKDEKITKNGP